MPASQPASLPNSVQTSLLKLDADEEINMKLLNELTMLIFEVVYFNEALSAPHLPLYKQKLLEALTWLLLLKS